MTLRAQTQGLLLSAAMIFLPTAVLPAAPPGLTAADAVADVNTVGGLDRSFLLGILLDHIERGGRLTMPVLPTRPPRMPDAAQRDGAAQVLSDPVAVLAQGDEWELVQILARNISIDTLLEYVNLPPPADRIEPVAQDPRFSIAVDQPTDVPEPATLLVLGLGGLLIRRPR